MNEPRPNARRPDRIRLGSALVAGLCAVASAANLLALGSDVGAEAFRWPAIGFVVAAFGYLAIACVCEVRGALGTALAHRGTMWLALSLLLLVWLILARGHASRMLLAGLAPTIAALGAGAGVLLLVALRERLILQQPATAGQVADPMALGAWQCALAAIVLLAAIYLETRPLSEVKPWEHGDRTSAWRPEHAPLALRFGSDFRDRSAARR